ncbi:MAG: hypothetical protein HY863_16785 [Chloroflexi bacterium]|nr:hypothetical protein [Chloroflexota bacterium]
MTEIILVVAKILGILIILCKFINKFAQGSDSAEAINLLGKSLSMRIGNFSLKRKS